MSWIAIAASVLGLVEPTVDVGACHAVSAETLRRYIAVEAHDAADLWKFQLRCEPDRVELSLLDPTGEAVASRQLPASDLTGQERTLALVFGELATSTPPPKPPEEAEDPTPAEPPPRPPEPVKSAPAKVSFVVRVQVLGAPLEASPRLAGTGSVGISLRPLQRMAWSVLADARGGRASFEQGTVEAWAVGLVVSPRFFVVDRELWSVDLGPELAGGWGRVQGRARESGARTSSVMGPYLDSAAVVTLGLPTPKVIVGFTLGMGYRTRQPEGVAEPGGGVSLGGAWVGGGIELRIPKRGRAPGPV
ncbi:MAG: hypothetical protein ACRBN8_29470 [Nannocystales bacterium]